MIIKLEHERKKRAEIEKSRKKIVRRYLWDIASTLPCNPWQKRVIVQDLRCLINSQPRMLCSRLQLEEEIGTPESIVQTYIGDDAVPILRRSILGRRIGFTAAAVLLVTLVTVLCVTFSSPMAHYTETIEVLDTDVETVTIQSPYSADYTDLALPRRGAKTVTCYDHRGTKLWSVTLTGTFGYLYSDTSQALETDCTLTVHTDNNLSVRKENFLFANAAVVSVTMDYNGLTLQKKVTLTCDQYGNLS